MIVYLRYTLIFHIAANYAEQKCEQIAASRTENYLLFSLSKSETFPLGRNLFF